MMTSMPRFSAVPAYSKSRSGVRWAETTRVSCGTWSSASVLEANFMVSQSEPEPMMMPTRGLEISRLLSVARRFGDDFAIVVCAQGEAANARPPLQDATFRTKNAGWEAGATKTPTNPEGGILRFFSARGDLSAVLPIVAKLADEIERAGDENNVFGGGLRERVVESFVAERGVDEPDPAAGEIFFQECY